MSYSNPLSKAQADELRRLGLLPPLVNPEVKNAEALLLTLKATGTDIFDIGRLMAQTFEWTTLQSVWASILGGIREWAQLIELLDAIAEINPDLAGRGLAEIPPSYRGLEGDFVLTNRSWVTEMPPNLFVVGNAIIKGCQNMVALPEDRLMVDGSLVLTRLPNLVQIPKSIWICRSMFISTCKSLVSIAEGEFFVGRSIRLVRCGSLASLPSNLRVHGNLEIAHCRSLKCFPDGLWVNETMDLRGTNCKMIKPFPTPKPWWLPLYSVDPQDGSEKKIFAKWVDLS